MFKVDRTWLSYFSLPLTFKQLTLVEGASDGLWVP